jgi:hypothetical protein
VRALVRALTDGMRRLSLVVVCIGACGTEGGPGIIEPDASRSDAGCGDRCGGLDGAPNLRPDLSAEEGAACARSLEVVLEAVDKYGQPFPRDPEGLFLVPIDADDFAFDTGKSRYVSGRDVTYTFDSDCYPKVMVTAPVLGGFGTEGLWIDRRCRFAVEIADDGCAEARMGRAESALRIVPPP